MTEAVMEPAQVHLKRLSQSGSVPKCGEFGDFFGCEDAAGCELHQACLRAWMHHTDLALNE